MAHLVPTEVAQYNAEVSPQILWKILPTAASAEGNATLVKYAKMVSVLPAQVLHLAMERPEIHPRTLPIAASAERNATLVKYAKMVSALPVQVLHLVMG